MRNKMENNQVNFDKPLTLIKDELDQLDLSIVGYKDKMNALKPYVDQYVEARDLKKNLTHQRKAKQGIFNIIINFYEKATGKKPDGIYPLFSQEQEQ
jgi:hypothetical protein